NTTNILDPIGFGKAEITVEPVANVIPVEHECALAEPVEFLLQTVGDSGFAGARETGKPQQYRFLSVQPRASGFGDLEGLEIGVCSAAQREADHTGGDGRVAVAVDQNKAAGNSILFIRSKVDLLGGREIDERDFVALQLFCRQVPQRS